jgi:hypothetical protein
MQLSVPWEVDAGEIVLWIWDEMTDLGGHPDNGSIDIRLFNQSNPNQFIRLRTYEKRMGQPATDWYLVTPQSPNNMGDALDIPRVKGWNQIVFHRTPDSLTVSVNGSLVTDESYRWDTPPRNLVYEISSRKGYNDGNPVWLSRLVITGTDMEETTDVANWSLY